jgi:hypothetical protein
MSAMKKFAYFLCVLALACQREHAEPEGSVTGLFNGADWATPGWSFKLYSAHSLGVAGEECGFATNALSIYKINPQGHARADLAFSKIPRKQGVFSLERTRPCRLSDSVGAEFFLLGADGDVLLQAYRVLESENNFFAVDNYDEQAGRMHGRFQVTFVVDPREVSKIPPDTIRFTNCTFDVPITKK